LIYNAFISYNHGADGRLAQAIQSALHRFAKPWYQLRAVHVFRDQTNLAINPALWPSIRDALDQSLFFILFASPESAASEWVEKECAYWIQRNGTSHLLIVLTGGTLQWDHAGRGFLREHTSALPGSVLRLFTDEPLFLDLRWARDGEMPLRLREPRFHEAVLQLASTLRNRPKDELDGADVRLQRQTRWMATAALGAIVLATVIALWLARLNREESKQSLAADLASRSAKVLRDHPDQAREAASLAIESNRLYPSFESNQALRAAVSLLPAAAQFYPPEDTSSDERVRDVAFTRDSGMLAVGRDNGSTQIIDLAKRQALGYFAPDLEPAAKIDVSGGAAMESPDSNAVVAAAFSMDGSLVAAGSRDGLMHVWAMPGGREVLRVFHAAPVSRVAFGPVTGQVMSAGEDGHVRIFDVAKAAMVADFTCSDKVVSATFSPDGNLVAALSSGGTVSIFSAGTHQLLRALSGGETAFNVKFSDDGKRVAAADGDFAFVWDVATGALLLKATHAASSETLTPQQWIVDAALSPDGNLLAYAARGDSLAHVWNVATGRQILALKHDSAVAAVTFNGDGTKLGTGSYDGTARVWELPSGNELERTAHAGGAEVVAFSTDGKRFAAGGVDGSVSVSESTRADRPESFQLAGQVRSVVFSPDERHFAIGSTSAHASPLVRFGNVGSHTVRNVEFHGAPVIDRLYYPDAQHVIAQWSNKLFVIAADGSPVTPLPDMPGEKQMDSSGKAFAIQENGISRVYELPGGAEIASLGSIPSTLVKIGAAGKILAFETHNSPGESLVDVWSLLTKARVSRISLGGELGHLEFDPGGNVLFTTQGETVQAWDIPSGRRRFSASGGGDIEFLTANSGGGTLATVIHGRATILDGESGARLAEIPDGCYVRAAAFSPDGRYFLTGCDEKSAALWLWRFGDLQAQACGRLGVNLSRDEWARLFGKAAYRLSCPGLGVGH